MPNAKEKDLDVKPTVGFTLPRWSTQRRMRRGAPVRTLEAANSDLSRFTLPSKGRGSGG
jgi:hypothetical protein